MTYDCKISIVVLGDMGVGKSSLLLRFAKNIFKEHLASTIIDCYYSDLLVRNKRVRLELWDTAGQERFKCVAQNYCRKADGVLLVYDVTEVTSFHRLTSWFLQLQAANETAVSIIVGNKIDDPRGNSVSVNMVKRFAEEQNLEFFESSAKTGENVTKIFEELTEKVLESKGLIPPDESMPPPIPQKINQMNLNLLKDSNSGTPNAIRDVKSVIPSPVLQLPPKENVKLHKTPRPVETKKSCC